MLEVDYADGVLVARGTSKVSQMALAGAYRLRDALAESGVQSVADVRAAKAQARADLGEPVVIPVDLISGVSLKRANALVNGNLVVTTVDGRRFELHFRRKSAAQFDALHAALVADLA